MRRTSCSSTQILQNLLDWDSIRQAEGRSWSACITLLNAVKLQEQESELTPGNAVLVVAKGTPGHSLLAGLSGYGFTLLPVADPIRMATRFSSASFSFSPWPCAT